MPNPWFMRAAGAGREPSAAASRPESVVPAARPVPETTVLTVPSGAIRRTPGCPSWVT